MAELFTATYTHGEGRDVTFETGRFAWQADGAVVVTTGDTQVLVTAVASKDVRAGIDFFPLTIDVEERMYAVGKIPGSFFRREGRPTEKAILMCRLIDRPLRPCFESGFRNEVQVILTVMSADQKIQPDVIGINGASAALLVSGMPFEGPVGAVRLGRIGDTWVPNPTFQELEEATFDLVVAGRRNPAGEVDIMMVEAGATDHALELIEAGAPDVTEEVVASGLEEAKQHIAASCDAQLALRELVTPSLRTFPVFRDYSDETYERVREAAGERLREVISIVGKAERNEAEAALRDQVMNLVGGDSAADDAIREIRAAFRSLVKDSVRRRILDEGVRIDGRGPTDLRALSCDVGLVKRAHGSGLFQRGETQVLSVATLGMLRMAQMLDTIGVEESKRYMHNYVMAPFATGETGRVGAPRRREIGHSALAERAMLPVLPGEADLPYAIRLVSEVLSSNGSTSMASVCGCALALMDAGVPIRAPVGGIAMGLVSDGDRFVTLTDILGAEDAFGDMDFKVAGTRTTVTALQLDTKLDGLPADVLAQALQQARDARMKILDAMEAALPAAREEMSVYAPKITSITVPVDKIGEIIGPKGKVINEIQGETGANIDVQDDGTVHIGGTDGAAVERAKAWIESIVNPPRAEIGARYSGKVVNVTKFGAFVNILPGRDGLLHISKLGGGRRINRVEDVLNLGDEIDVVVEDIDRQDRVSLRPVEDGAATPAASPDEDFAEDEWEDEESSADEFEAEDEFEDEDEEFDEEDEFEDEFEDEEPPPPPEPAPVAGGGRRRRRRGGGERREAAPEPARGAPRTGAEDRGAPRRGAGGDRRSEGERGGASRERRVQPERAPAQPRRERVSFEEEFERQSRSGPRRRGR